MAACRHIDTHPNDPKMATGVQTGFSLSGGLQPLLALNTFGLQLQQPPEFLSVMLRQWHVIRSGPRQSISTPGHGFTYVHGLHV